jgi:formylglycine-generating enzyme required for sulfatase activity
MGAGLPDILWCEIPAGAFTMGTREQDIPGLMKKYGGGESWYKSETPQHEEKSITRAYLIGKYPVTNAQYNAFVQAGGYANAQYWQEAIAHKYWKDGKFKGRWDDDWRIGAYNFGAPFNLDNHPVVGVSWYEAVAFCRWLTEKFRIADFRFQIENNRDEKMKSEIKNLKFEIRLPTEAEWEKAARGPSTPLRSAQDSTHAQDARIFPWNGQLTPQHANYSETKIGATSAVGIFPAGASPYGLLDASGNVWEWCSTKWIENYKGYDKKIKEREGLEGDDLRVLRGGAFGSVSNHVRAASRDWLDSLVRDHFFGFRVVASLL